MLRRLHREEEGAVLAEFVIAFVPLLLVFFSFLQLSKIATVRLVVKHGAIIGARAAAVISNVNDNLPEGGGGEADITAAVNAAMAPWISKGAITDVAVEINDTSDRKDPYNWVSVTVTATYRCSVPMGFVACGGGSKKLKEMYRMPHQGAAYKL